MGIKKPSCWDGEEAAPRNFALDSGLNSISHPLRAPGMDGGVHPCPRATEDGPTFLLPYKQKHNSILAVALWGFKGSADLSGILQSLLWNSKMIQTYSQPTLQTGFSLARLGFFPPQI